ncbi:hypothetical protein [Selenomonas ruminantium]|uniref:Uncharacterized protein n=1 Tax=Selenomonas ruminantium TaxID=971 RepID=A0A1I0YAZ5_SELRU|nr:hypothetical protein [Selenomonas ruminantium]SFB09926.1 hypothetical protein SAMN05216587_11111 [Selenomonas ruminantium]
MTYLTEEEISRFCGLVTGVTMEHIEAASALIDAYKGCSFAPTEHEERVDLSYRRTTEETRGRLKHFPRIAIEKITARSRTPFGVDTTNYEADCLEFDSEESPYFSFYMPRWALFREMPRALTVKYTSGYAEVPEEIKRACGILACNIKQMGGVLRWKSRDDYDIKVTLGNEGVMTEEIKGILDGVRVQ